MRACTRERSEAEGVPDLGREDTRVLREERDGEERRLQEWECMGRKD
jgi:hypothetical protein